MTWRFTQQRLLLPVLLPVQQPQRLLQVCQIGAVWFPGTHLGDVNYLDSENIDGTLAEQFQRGMAFIKRSLHHVQAGRGFNTLGQLEVPEEAFVELLVNALVHRDFFVSATIRLFVFTDRVEIISPGHLPDSLTPEQIRTGVSNRRNKVLAEHAAHILPYRGLGTVGMMDRPWGTAGSGEPGAPEAARMLLSHST